MKATINNITVEGTPEEIVQVIKLIGEGVKTQPHYVPVPYYPLQPTYPNKPRYVDVPCGGSYQGTAKTPNQ